MLLTDPAFCVNWGRGNCATGGNGGMGGGDDDGGGGGSEGVYC